MKPGPSQAVRVLIGTIEVTAPPKPATEWLVEICLSQEWCSTAGDAEEYSERWTAAFLGGLQRELRACREVGRFAAFDFNTSSDYMIQGVAFIEPNDPVEVKAWKSKTAYFKSFVALLGNLSPTEFEQMCVGIVTELGSESATLTKRTGDEGIDFYGQLLLEKLLFGGLKLPGWERQLKVWIVGQAKHYKAMPVSTPDIRELVGSVVLAKAGAYSSAHDIYPDLKMRVCDPVFYVFMTTGRISAAGWRLLDRSGVIGMDGPMVAAFLADRAVGIVAGKFDELAFADWLRKFSSL